MARAVGCAAPPLVVNLGGGDVLMAEQLLHLADIEGTVEQQRGVGRSQRMRRIDPAFCGLPSLAVISFTAPGGRIKYPNMVRYIVTSPMARSASSSEPEARPGQ